MRHEPTPLATAEAPTTPLAFSARGVRLARGGATILDGFSLDVPASGVTAIMGPNGAGKSVALRLIAGLLAPEAGTVAWAGGPAPARHETALVFQRPVLLRRTVEGNLLHALATYGVARRDRAARLATLLEEARLAEHARRPARVLSGGEQQRLAMVRALAMRPRLLLLDEPTASLDPRATKLIEDMIRKSAADGIAVAIVSHDAGQAGRLADRVAFIHAGRVREITPTDAFLERPRSEEARAYLGGRLLL